MARLPESRVPQHTRCHIPAIHRQVVAKLRVRSEQDNPSRAVKASDDVESPFLRGSPDESGILRLGLIVFVDLEEMLGWREIFRKSGDSRQPNRLGCFG